MKCSFFGGLQCLINPHTGKKKLFFLIFNISYALVQALDINAEALSLCRLSD